MNLVPAIPLSSWNGDEIGRRDRRRKPQRRKPERDEPREPGRREHRLPRRADRPHEPSSEVWTPPPPTWQEPQSRCAQDARLIDVTENWSGVDTWGPRVKVGPHLRLQAQVGYRAAVIPLRPGLYLVAELPEAATRSEFGFVPLLAPLMVKAATRALNPQQAQQPGMLQKLIDMRQERLEQGTALIPSLRRQPEQVEPADVLGWVDPGDEFGCDACGGS
ncbi:MAG: hypothetical protein H6739_38005 [Alphaproteobacteria bacterium]|nr:hypothetical protein [Alphaproteobacteria bacterium]